MTIGVVEVQFNTLPQLAAGLGAGVQRVLNDSATDIAEEAIRITSTAYPPASAPGEPPAMRTAELNASIHAVPDAGPLEADVVAGTDYAVTLEYGGVNLAARPFMTPAVETKKAAIQERLNGLLP